MSPTASTSSATNPGIAELLQTLSNSGNSILSSPAITAALQNAPPQDVAELSTAAVQMQGMSELFGMTSGTSAASASPADPYTTDMTNILANLNASVAGGNAASASPGQSLSSQLAQYQLDAQGAENAALLGSGSTVSTLA
jgi:hypothetical protein